MGRNGLALRHRSVAAQVLNHFSFHIESTKPACAGAPAGRPKRLGYITLIFFCFLFSQHTLYSQSKSGNYQKIYHNEVFGEALGTGGWNSLNYGKILFHKNRFSGMAKAGIGYFPRMIKIIHFRTLSLNVVFKI